MELFYTLTSPYSRKILLVLDHLGLTDKTTLTFLHPFEDQTGRLKAANPLGKIPTLLLEDGFTVYDSPVIASALFERAETPELSFEENLKQQKMQALADGMMDAAVLSQQEKCREDAEQSAFWLDNWQSAILRGLKEFEDHAIHDAGDWHIGSISMACALDYIRFRHPDLDWMEDFPLSSKWYQTATKMNIMIKTDPRQS